MRKQCETSETGFVSHLWKDGKVASHFQGSLSNMACVDNTDWPSLISKEITFHQELGVVRGDGKGEKYVLT